MKGGTIPGFRRDSYAQHAPDRRKEPISESSFKTTELPVAYVVDGIWFSPTPYKTARMFVFCILLLRISLTTNMVQPVTEGPVHVFRYFHALPDQAKARHAFCRRHTINGSPLSLGPAC